MLPRRLMPTWTIRLSRPDWQLTQERLANAERAVFAVQQQLDKLGQMVGEMHMALMPREPEE